MQCGRGSGGCVCEDAEGCVTAGLKDPLGLDAHWFSGHPRRGAEQTIARLQAGRGGGEERTGERVYWVSTHTLTCARAATVRTYPGLWAALRCTAKGGWMG